MKKQLVLGLILIPALCEAQTSRKPALLKVNTQAPFDARCIAETRIEDKDAPGGFAKSANLPRPIGKMKVKSGGISLEAFPNQIAVFAGQYRGMTLRLINASTAPKAFQASDSRLYIVQEARDQKGEWKPIETLPSSFCGNSYHQVFLGPREFWSFAVPRYEGAFQTKLRFRLKEKNMLLYSNEFGGSINPKQFDFSQRASLIR